MVISAQETLEEIRNAVETQEAGFTRVGHKGGEGHPANHDPPEILAGAGSPPANVASARVFYLSDDETEILYREAVGGSDDAGFHMFIAALQYSFDPQKKTLTVADRVLNILPRLAFDHYNPVWEGILMGIFSRHLGRNLGR